MTVAMPPEVTRVAQLLPGRPVREALISVAREERKRAQLEDALDQSFARRTMMLGRMGHMHVREVIVGGGVHAAIYAANARSRPLVLERGRAGGVFALCRPPAFYLNSRNRPGEDPGVAGRGGALNAMPGAVLQASDLSGAEYQDQAELSFAVRASLALQADVMTGAEVMDVSVVERPGRRPMYRLDVLVGGRESYSVTADRVIDARGIGTERRFLPLGSSAVRALPRDRTGILTFEGFLRAVESGWQPGGVVAVVGAGDSSKVVLEYLVGQGPDQRVRPDLIERVDWIGQECTTKERYEAGERSRYKGLARFMPRGEDALAPYKIRPTPARANDLRVNVTYGDVPEARRLDLGFVNGYREGYDYVVLCVGYQPHARWDGLGEYERASVFSSDFYVGEAPAAVGMRYESLEVYEVGPMAGLTVTAAETLESPVLARVPANTVALFRYAARTAEVARGDLVAAF